MKKISDFGLLSFLCVLSACSSLPLGESDGREDPTKIVAGDSLPSAQHEFDEAIAKDDSESSHVERVETEIKDKSSSSEKVKQTDDDTKKAVVSEAEDKDNSQESLNVVQETAEVEEKPLVDQVEMSSPDEVKKLPDISYLSDEEFIASVERAGSARTIEVKTEELSVTTLDEVAESNVLPEKVFVPSVTYQLDTFYFANGSSFLEADYRERIRKIVRAAKKDNAHVRVVGHASSRTNDTDIATHKLVNFEVSQKRAEAVAAELRRAGLPAELISVEAMSDSAPAYLEVMPEGERLNRRVEVFISY